MSRNDDANPLETVGIITCLILGVFLIMLLVRGVFCWAGVH